MNTPPAIEVPLAKPEAKPLKMKKKIVPVAEKYTNLQEACREVVHHLNRKGVQTPKSEIELIGDGLKDEKTGALVVNALAPVSFLLTRFSGLSHWFQRKTFHHTRDKIYRKPSAIDVLALTRTV